MIRHAMPCAAGVTSLAGLLAIVAAVSISMGDAAADATRACWFTRVAGNVHVERANAVRAAYAGLVLDAQDRVVSATDGRAALACSDRVEITVGGGTRIDVRDFPSGDVTGSVLLDLIDGLVRIVAPPSGDWSGFAVRTPQAIASVRSTEWVTISDSGTSSVFLVEGVIAVADRDGTVETELRPGEGVDIAEGAIVDGPKRWGEGRIAETMARLAFP